MALTSLGRRKLSTTMETGPRARDIAADHRCLAQAHVERGGLAQAMTVKAASYYCADHSSHGHVARLAKLCFPERLLYSESRPAKRSPEMWSSSTLENAGAAPRYHDSKKRGREPKPSGRRRRKQADQRMISKLHLGVQLRPCPCHFFASPGAIAANEYDGCNMRDASNACARVYLAYVDVWL